MGAVPSAAGDLECDKTVARSCAPGAADCVCQRGQSIPGPRGHPASGNRRAPLARRHPGTTCPAAPGREPGACGVGLRGRFVLRTMEQRAARSAETGKRAAGGHPPRFPRDLLRGRCLLTDRDYLWPGPGVAGNEGRSERGPEG